MTMTGAIFIFLFLIKLIICEKETIQIEENDCNFDPGWRPSLYSVQLATYIHKSERVRNFNGKVEIDGITTSDRDILSLHSKVNISGASYSLQGKVIPLSENSITTNETTGIVNLELSETLLQGTQFKLHITFNGIVRNRNGIFLTHYKSKEGPKPVIATEFQATYARCAFPCIDIPKVKSIFEFKIARPQNMISAFNTQLKRTSHPDPEIDNQVWDTYFPTPIMSTYSLAFIISDYIRVNISANSSFLIPNDFKEDISYAATVTPYYIKAMEEYTGINYALNKLDHVTVPDLAGVAMENWGLIIWIEHELLLKKGRTTILEELRLITFMAHEISHQWFGNLVTCEYWTFTWLNEGIATYLMALLANQVFPSSKRVDLLVVHDIQDILYSESIGPEILTIYNMCTDQEIKETFSTSSYYKGAAILRMVESIISEEVMRLGLITLLKKNAFGSVKEFQLWESIQENVDQSLFPENETLNSVMTTWTSNKGYPHLEVYRHVNSTGLYVYQEQFQILRSPTGSFYWWIPLSYTTSNEKDFERTKPKEWIKPSGKAQNLHINVTDDEWVIFNIQQSAYYRVNYDIINWKLLTKQLIDENLDEIHPLNRAQLIDDAFTFASGGLLNYSIVLDLSRFLKKEKHYYTWSSALRALESLAGWTQGSNLSFPLEIYAKFLIVNIYGFVTSNEFKITDPLSRLLQSEVVEFACEIGVNNCKYHAIATARFIMENQLSEQRINPDLWLPLWCNAARFGGIKLWKYIKQRFIDAENKRDKNVFFEALCCTDDDASLKRFLKDIFDEAEYLKNEDHIEIINSIFRDETSCSVIDYFKENFDEFVKKHGKDKLEEHLDMFTTSRIREVCREKLKALIKEKSLSVLINENNIWAERFYTDVNAWVTENMGENMSALIDFGERVHREYNELRTINVFIDHGQTDFYKTFNITNIQYQANLNTI